MDARFTDLLRPFLRFLGEQDINPDSRLRDLGLDSMQSIELLFAIEDEFAIALPDEDLNDRTFATAGSLWAAVRSAQLEEAA